MGIELEQGGAPQGRLVRVLGGGRKPGYGGKAGSPARAVSMARRATTDGGRMNRQSRFLKHASRCTHQRYKPGAWTHVATGDCGRVNRQSFSKRASRSPPPALQSLAPAPIIPRRMLAAPGPRLTLVQGACLQLYRAWRCNKQPCASSRRAQTNRPGQRADASTRSAARRRQGQGAGEAAMRCRKEREQQ